MARKPNLSIERKPPKLSPNAQNLTATVTRVAKGRILAEAQRRSTAKAAYVSIGVLINDWAMSLPPAPGEPQTKSRSHSLHSPPR